MTNLTDLYSSRTVKKIMADGEIIEEDSYLINEHELSILVNEHFLMKLVCTKQNLEELVWGKLLVSGIIDRVDDIKNISFDKYQNEARVFLNTDFNLIENHRKFKILPKSEYKIEWIFELAKLFQKDTEIHSITSNAHSCMLSRKGELLFKCEDIGRHNAIDKAVGYALRNGIPLSECIIYTSGRIPVDMAEKAIAAGIPVLVSKAVPTNEAVNLAQEYGLVIISNARPDSMKVYE